MEACSWPWSPHQSVEATTSHASSTSTISHTFYKIPSVTRQSSSKRSNVECYYSTLQHLTLQSFFIVRTVPYTETWLHLPSIIPQCMCCTFPPFLIVVLDKNWAFSTFISWETSSSFWLFSVPLTFDNAGSDFEGKWVWVSLEGIQLLCQTVTGSVQTVKLAVGFLVCAHKNISLSQGSFSGRKVEDSQLL